MSGRLRTRYLSTSLDLFPLEEGSSFEPLRRCWIICALTFFVLFTSSCSRSFARSAREALFSVGRACSGRGQFKDYYPDELSLDTLAKRDCANLSRICRSSVKFPPHLGSRSRDSGIIAIIAVFRDFSSPRFAVGTREIVRRGIKSAPRTGVHTKLLIALTGYKFHSGVDTRREFCRAFRREPAITRSRFAKRLIVTRATSLRCVRNRPTRAGNSAGRASARSTSRTLSRIRKRSRRMRNVEMHRHAVR